MESDREYNSGLIIVTVIILVSLLLIIILYLTQQSFTNIDIVKINNFGVNEQYPWGSSRNGIYEANNARDLNEINLCQLNPRAEWNQTRCVCKLPYFGSSCQYQTYDRSYREIGPIERPQWNLDLGLNYKTPWLTFNSDDQESCTQICSNDSDCAGIIWTVDQQNCQLLRDIPSLRNQQIPEYTTALTPGQQRLFLKQEGMPDLSDRVIISRGQPQWRPWLITSINNQWYSVQTIFPLRTVAINWTPDAAINDGKMIGVYSKYPQTINNTPNGVRTQDWFVIYPGGTFNVLPNWDTYYIVYYPSASTPFFTN